MSFKIKDGVRIGTVDVFNNSGVLLVNAPTATSIAGGASWQIPVQSAAGTTTFITNLAGDSGKFLKSTGAGTTPVWDTIPAATTVAVDNTATVYYPLFTSQNTGSLTTTLVDNTTTPLSYVPSTSTLTATNFAGNATTATTATTATKATNLVGGNNTTLLGSIGYQSNTDTTTLLAPNTTAVKLFLTQTGTGSNGAAPAWGGIADGDIPSALTSKTYNGLTLTAATTGFTIAGGTTSKTLTMSNTLTFSGTDTSSVAFGTGGTVAYTGGKLSQFAATTSAELAGVLSDETGYNAGGVVVFSKNPTIEDLTVSGNLTVNGTTTTINSTTISVDDKNIELGSVTSPDDTSAEGGGITLKGTTDKTITWTTATGAWNSSENLNLVTGKVYKINNVEVLNSTTLGSAVVNSSLTKVGALSGGAAGVVKADTSGNLTTQVAVTGLTSLTGTTSLDVLTTTTGTLTLDSGTTGAINIGTSANGKTITIGNTTSNTGIVINASTAGIILGATVYGSASASGNLTLSSTSNATKGTVTVGDSNSGTLTLQGATVNLKVGAAAVGYLKAAATTGALSNVATIPATDGGTGIATYAAGDIIYASAIDTLAKLAKGSDTQVLQLNGGVPTWATVAGTDTQQGISDDTATATPRYITFVANATGAQGGLSATNLLFTPSTGLLNATALKSTTQTLRVSSEDISVKSAVVNDSITDTTNTVVDTWAHAIYRSAKYIVQITQSTNYQVSEVMVIHNGTTTTMTEYGVLETNGALATITSAINGANVELKVQLGGVGPATINIEKTVIVL